MIPAKARKMRIILIVWGLMAIAANSQGTPPPEWLQSYHDGLLNLKEVYYGVGSADYPGEDPDHDTRRLSKDRALDELCYQLSVSIQSDLKERIVQKGNYSEQQVASSLFVSSRKVFSGIQERHKWDDQTNGRFWTMVVIDKGQADRQVRQQAFIKEVVDRLEHKQDEILSGIKAITGLMQQQMQQYEKRMKQFNVLLSTIDSKIDKSGNQSQSQYQTIRNDIQRLDQQWQHREKLAQDQNAKMDELMQQNKALQSMLAQLGHQVQADHFLAMTQEDIQNQAVNPEFKVRITPLKGQGAEYIEGESIRFKVEATRDCYIKVIYLSSVGDATQDEKRMNILLFPNVHDRNNYIHTGRPELIGRLNELVVEPPYGKDIVTVVASETQFEDIDQLLAQARGQYYAEITNSVEGALAARTRGIGVAAQATKSAEHPEAAFVTDTCFIISRKR